MRRNELFQTVASVQMSRSKFDLSHSSSISFNQGDLVPFEVREVLPGDTHDIDLAALFRSITPIYPVMDNAKLDTYFFFVPNRLTWDKWKEFTGENESHKWDDSKTTYYIPSMTLSAIYSAVNSAASGDAEKKLCISQYSLFRYIGNPAIYKVTGIHGGTGASAPTATALSPYLSGAYTSFLPIRAYRLIANYFFRSTACEDPVPVDTGSTPHVTELSMYSTGDNGFYKAGRLHDYFSSVLPAPQYGVQVSVPLVNPSSGEIPVVTKKEGASIVSGYDTSRQTLTLVSNAAVFANTSPVIYHGAGSGDGQKFGKAVGADQMGSYESLADTDKVQPANLVVDLSTVNGTAINTLRLAFATQRWSEKMARSGTRYFEQLRAVWGVISSDAVQQMPQYLGGGTLDLQTKQVLQTSSDSGTSPLGQTGAFSLTSGMCGKVTHSFEEHGYIIGLAVLRVERTYSQGISRQLQRRSFFDFYTPELSHIGEQQVSKSELYAGNGDDAVFGYKEAWTEYRYAENEVKGMLEPALQNGFQAWTYADYYTSMPTFSRAWFEEGLTNVDATIKVQASGNYEVQQFFGQFFMNWQAVRVMPPRSTPGLIDHF